jgi:iron complex outermembrane receptor protein
MRQAAAALSWLAAALALSGALAVLPAVAQPSARPAAPPAPAASAAVSTASAAAASAPTAAAPPAATSVTVQGRRDSEADERRHSVVGLTVLGRDELDRAGDTSVLDVLARVAGIDIDGEQPRLRGLGGGYTQILLNGEPAPPGFALDQLAPADIERIEVIKGPTAEFGGVAGTINVILRRAPRLRQTELRQGLGRRVGRSGAAPICCSRWSR